MCLFHSHLAHLSFAPPPGLSRSKSLPPFCVTQRTMLQSTAYQEFLLRNYLPSKGKSLTDNMSENGRFVCSVFCRSGEGNPAARPFCLWSLHGKGSYKLGIAPRIIKHLSSSYFPAAGGDGARNNSTVQGLWAGEVGWPLTAPEGNMPSNLG